MAMEQQPGGSDERKPSPSRDDATERLRRYVPHLYAADLASLERGIRHGLWIDADQDSDDLDADIAAMLDSSPTVGADAWAIHGTQDFAGMALSGQQDTALISRLARGVVHHGEAFAVYADWRGTDAQQLSQFSDHYLGTYANLEAWGRAALNELQWPEQIRQRLDPEMTPYVRLDYGAWAKDASRDVYVAHGSEGIHVFRP
jgi:antirestriction protein